MSLASAASIPSFGSTDVAPYGQGLSTLPTYENAELNRNIDPVRIVEPNQAQFDTSADDYVASPTFPIVKKIFVERAPASRTALLAEWDGCVTDIPENGFYFSATLKGKVGEGVEGVEEDATIPLGDVAEGDKDLLRLGNFFRLCVIQLILPSGQPRRYTDVVFRRMPAYRRDDLEKANERAREIVQGLCVDAD